MGMEGRFLGLAQTSSLPRRVHYRVQILDVYTCDFSGNAELLCFVNDV